MISKNTSNYILDPSIVQFLQWKRKSSAPLESIPETAPKTKHVETETEIENESTLEIVQNSNYGNWANFGIVEPKKLEWMKDISTKLPVLKPDQVYEARFEPDTVHL